MPTLLDVLELLTGTIGKGALHQTRVAEQGGDYIQRRGAADRAVAPEAMRQASTLQSLLKNKAAVSALARRARTREETGGDPSLEGIVTDLPGGGYGFQRPDGSITDNQEPGTVPNARPVEAPRSDEELAADYTAQLEEDRIQRGNRISDADLDYKAALARAARARADEDEYQVSPEGRAATLADKIAVAKATASFRPEPQSLRIISDPMGNQRVVDLRKEGAGANLGPGPVPVGERRTRAEAQGTVAMLEQMLNIPDSVTGPKAGMEAKLRDSLIADLFGMDPSSPDRASGQALSGVVRDDIVHKLTGAAASVPEMQRLMQHIPDINQRNFKTNVRLTLAGVRLAEEILSGAIQPDQARVALQEILQQAMNPAAAPTSDLPGGGFGTPPAAGAPRRIRVDENGNPIG